MCAREICFQNELLRQFFLNGKTLPIDRGSGVDQPIMGVASRLLQGGQWLHIFPEGKVHFSGQLGPFKWGIGKVICDVRRATGRDPIVLPFHHSGMGRVLPMHHLVPRVGHQVDILVGQPLDLADITCRCYVQGEDQRQVWKDIALRMHRAAEELQAQSPENPNQLNSEEAVEHAPLTDRA